MKTRIDIDGTKFLVNGAPTYEGVFHNGKPVEGLLLNSRMIQAIADDENPGTRDLWRYPDTGRWDPDRNTAEFCSQLPRYREHGLLAVTVGLQGGGSVYTPEAWNAYRVSAFHEDGSIKEDWARRLQSVLAAADDCGMVVIINFFYWKQVRHIPDNRTIHTCVEAGCDWLLRSGYRNVLVDLCNESAPWWQRPVCEPENIHKLIEIAQGVRVNGERLLVSCSTGGGNQVPAERWQDTEDFDLPHGNGCTPTALRSKLHKIKSSDAYRRRPRPVVVNEDSIRLENLEAAVDEHCSWGFYAQGRGSRDPTYEAIWGDGGREAHVDDLSGFQTLPVNWSLNTPFKEDFFARTRVIAGLNGLEEEPLGIMLSRARRPDDNGPAGTTRLSGTH